MDDFLSIENYQIITGYLVNIAQKKFKTNINISDYDRKIYQLMDKIYTDNKNLGKMKGNLLIIQLILADIEKDVLNNSFEKEKQISMKDLLILEKVKANTKKVRFKNPPQIIPKEKQGLSKLLENRQLNGIYRIKNDIDPLKMYKELDIQKQQMNKPVDLNPPKQYQVDYIIPKPAFFKKEVLYKKIYGDDNINVNYLTIDSRDRNTDIFIQPNAYQIHLPEEYDDVIKVELITAEVPKSGYLIETYNNILHFQELNFQVSNNSYYEAEIIIGNYTKDTITMAIANAMNLVGQSSYDVLIVDGKIKIQSDLAGGDNIFNLLLKEGYENYGTDTIRSKYMLFSSGRTLGFKCVNLTGANNYTANKSITFQGEDYIMLEIPELEGLIDNVQGDNTLDFTKILLNSEPGKITFYSDLYIYPSIKTYKQSLKLSRFTINFKVFGNYLYNFNGLEHSMTFKIITLKQKIYSDIDLKQHLDVEHKDIMVKNLSPSNNKIDGISMSDNLEEIII